MKVNNRVVASESSKCQFCDKVITLGFIKRLNCNATCSRMAIYVRDSLLKEKRVKDEFKVSYELFRTYMGKMIQTEPMIYYKEWEKYLKQNTIPPYIHGLINLNLPLPRPNQEGFGLPKIEIVMKEKLIHV